MAAPAIPPTTPPTIAPVCDDEDEESSCVEPSAGVEVVRTVEVTIDVYCDPLASVPL